MDRKLVVLFAVVVFFWYARKSNAFLSSTPTWTIDNTITDAQILEVGETARQTNDWASLIALYNAYSDYIHIAYAATMQREGKPQDPSWNNSKLVSVEKISDYQWRFYYENGSSPMHFVEHPEAETADPLTKLIQRQRATALYWQSRAGGLSLPEFPN
jgi:hypothetical protein